MMMFLVSGHVNFPEGRGPWRHHGGFPSVQLWTCNTPSWTCLCRLICLLWTWTEDRINLHGSACRAAGCLNIIFTVKLIPCAEHAQWTVCKPEIRSGEKGRRCILDYEVMWSAALQEMYSVFYKLHHELLFPTIIFYQPIPLMCLSKYNVLFISKQITASFVPHWAAEVQALLDFLSGWDQTAAEPPTL